MPIYKQLGKIPRKRHVVFEREGGGLYYEHLMGNKGFTGPASLMYHLRRPTLLKEVREPRAMNWETDPDLRLRPRHLFLHRLGAGGSPVLDRVPALFNADVAISMVQPDRADEFFYRNSQGDELLFISEGEGLLESTMGLLPFGPGDYIVIPRGIIHRLVPEGSARILVIESAGAVETPRRYRNEFGQYLEHSPFCERDIRAPERLETHDEEGEFVVLTKMGNALHEMVMGNHPFDVVGWDGHCYPWAFNIHDFEPLVGRLHMPPPIHQTFQSDGFVICSFVPRLYDFHPEAIPAPYNHSNVMTDEVLYYARDKFMSRKGIEFGSMTLHPDGFPHGPQPGMIEKSVGAKDTDELAVMIDTFRPLQVARDVLGCEDADYIKSWLE
jgi:homogentisate 1,2-dioxygenase